MAIPKKIHWCWLSGDPLPKTIQQCVNSWKRIMPDYEIILWDKSRFDIHSVKFVEDACAHKKWAYAADYIRLWALYTEGGIYLDSDVMVFGRFDKFLHHSVFSSIEYVPAMYVHRNEKYKYAGYGIQAAILGAEKGHGWIKACLEHYSREKIFKMGCDNNLTDVEVCPWALARMAESYGFRYDLPVDEFQYLNDGIVIYPLKVFSMLYSKVDMQTVAIHVGEGSWFGDTYHRQRRSEPRWRKLHRYLCSNYRFFGMLHFRYKEFCRKNIAVKI